jgi:hypothetical protein
MKRNPKEQLMALIRGLQMDAGVSMEDLLERAPAYFEQVGTDFQRLAAIGYETVDAMEKKEAREKKKKAAKGAFGKGKGIS